MSKTLVILLVIALVWLGAWSIAGYFMYQAGVEKTAQAEHLSSPATRLERGADIRVEGIIAEGPSTLAPFSRKPCLAAVTYISVASSYRDSQDRLVHDSSHIATRRSGPELLEITIGDRRVELPLERWSPRGSESHSMDTLPPQLGVTQEEIARGEENARGSPGNYNVSEATIDTGTRVFVVGRLEDREGPLRLDVDRVLERVVLHPGSQEDLVNQIGSGGGGLRIAGWILGGGVGPLPLVILGLVVLVRSRRRPAPPNVDPDE